MKRDNLSTIGADRIIFPLDLPTWGEAIGYVRKLRDHVGVFKIGLELFISVGPDIIKEVKAVSGRPVFLDMKLHDIPETVSRAAHAAARHEIDFLTFHPEDGAELKSKLADLPERLNLLGITLLTSVSVENRAKSERICIDKAALAVQNGAAGIVSSPLEAAKIRSKFPDLLIITPGVRPDWCNIRQDDQSRTATPMSAMMAGSDYIVIGRPLRDAKDPVEAACRIADEIEAGFKQEQNRKRGA